MQQINIHVFFMSTFYGLHWKKQKKQLKEDIHEQKKGIIAMSNNRHKPYQLLQQILRTRLEYQWDRGKSP